MRQAGIPSVLEKHAAELNQVIPFDKASDKIVALNLAKSNHVFSEDIYNDIDAFNAYIDQQRKNANATYLIGGYREMREMYRRSTLFDNSLIANLEHPNEPRTLHLGTDIWGDADTKIFAPWGGMVHSFAFNNNYGDYGATIILQHQLDSFNFYTLYGHLSLKDIDGLRKGKFVSRGENFAQFGTIEENGNWPPHLHFQLVVDMGNYNGDYPGVCKMSEAEKYLKNSPDPDLVLQLNRFIQ